MDEKKVRPKAKKGDSGRILPETKLIKAAKKERLGEALRKNLRRRKGK